MHVSQCLFPEPVEQVLQVEWHFTHFLNFFSTSSYYVKKVPDGQEFTHLFSYTYNVLLQYLHLIFNVPLSLNNLASHKSLSKKHTSQLESEQWKQ